MADLSTDLSFAQPHPTLFCKAMSQPAVRPWLAAARCAPKSFRTSAGWSRVVARYQSTEANKPLETPEDWYAFRERRAEQQLLCSYTIDLF